MDSNFDQSRRYLTSPLVTCCILPRHSTPLSPIVSLHKRSTNRCELGLETSVPIACSTPPSSVLPVHFLPLRPRCEASLIGAALPGRYHDTSTPTCKEKIGPRRGPIFSFW